MIPKPLDQIEWADLELLKDSGREESDTIEYKGSFSGGSDYLSFSDSQRDKAIKGIAREVIAFLNGRGGDVVIGAEEADGDNPKIKSFNSLPNVGTVADRLAQSLSAVIEPYQSVVGVRAIRNGSDDEGVIVVRAPQSLRAPHRLTKDRECYIRRGRESVPMPMDEIQDLTLVRTARRSELLARMESAFIDLGFAKIRRVSLPHERFRVKIIYLPLVTGEIEISSATLAALRSTKPSLSINGRHYDHSSVLDSLDHQGKPMLRGRMFEGHRDRGARQLYCSASITSSLALEWDYVDSGRFLRDRAEPEIGLFEGWVIGFFARAVLSLQKILELNSPFAQGVLRVGVYANGIQRIIVGNDQFGDTFDLPEGRILIPDFELSEISDLEGIFDQLQSDFFAIAGVDDPDKFVISNWP